MGGRKWKQLHRTIYFMLPLVLLHSILVGADFGWKRGPEVSGEADAGALIAFLSIAAGWLGLFELRQRGI